MMKKTTLALASALVGTVAVSAAALAQSGPAQPPAYKFEKCFGVVKAGMNDCQSASGSCAGSAKRDAQPDAWVYLPAGTCNKLVGASTEKK